MVLLARRQVVLLGRLVVLVAGLAQTVELRLVAQDLPGQAVHLAAGPALVAGRGVLRLAPEPVAELLRVVERALAAELAVVRWWVVLAPA